MKWTNSTGSMALLVGIFLTALAGSAAAQDKAEKHELSGSVTATATQVAAGIGWTWGKGTLTLLDGSQHDFKVSGLDVVAVGVKQASIVGNVYNLKNLEDFEGTYSKATAAIAVGAGAGASTMRNEKGVVINVTGTGAGVDVRLAASGMSVKLVK